ncbi:hypothetical protein IAG44_25295 [Streptomyces roseirectus]|uniref:Immunity protein 50 n=1 Tax=Streptomyces roseirectus TaxID=2768066 RepID=A0A7H0IHZ1_9ACTN|nr:Imm50 family immunity protein [Streptomyces roseirectus]QNP72407.1 hypothetical protein IAG44_25295 [Streptomyces roseirectus]
MTVDEFIVNSQVLSSAYGYVPQLGGNLRLRSVNISWSGPTVTLRVDLPHFPDQVPQEWEDAGVDTAQCQLQFLDVSDLRMAGWNPPIFALVKIVSCLERRRIQVVVDAVNQESFLSFDCSDSVVIGHFSAFRMQDDGMDGGPRIHVKRLDSHLYDSLPATCEKVYYERI